MANMITLYGMVMCSVKSGGLFLNPALCLAGTYYSIREL
jgi:hypothetical protein